VTRRRFALIIGAVALVVLSACNRISGRPSPSAWSENPSQVTDFIQLYAENCAGCHGTDGQFGAALPLNNSTYLAIVADASVRDAIANGINGTSMPAFAIASGGMLTDAQITAVVSGIRSQWGHGAGLVTGAPAYLAEGAGDAASGAKLFGEYCGSCHGDGSTGGKAGAVADGSFLALYNDQSLRTLIIAGRPDLGHPGWHDYPGKPPLASAQVNDLVAWLAAQRQS
jgi:cytochrome c oxidase cbb3-type subunit III